MLFYLVYIASLENFSIYSPSIDQQTILTIFLHLHVNNHAGSDALQIQSWPMPG